MTTARVTDEAVEVLVQNFPKARVADEAVEVLIQNFPKARVTDEAVEVLLVIRRNRGWIVGSVALGQ